MGVFYNFISGENIKAVYFFKGILREIIPSPILCHDSVEQTIKKAKHRPDYDYIMERVDYYCKAEMPLGDDTVRVCDIRRKDSASSYYFDLKEYMLPFPSKTPINFLPGDITYSPQFPSLTKSRPISKDNQTSVILKLDKIRHFIWANDKVPYEKKLDKVVFRGKIPGKHKRESFFSMYYGDPLCDLGDTSRHGISLWHAPKMTLNKQLRFKFILALEGNDVASNLKWVMGSNSVAVMPEPEYETWFMEGRLKPDYHYIRINRDFSDFHERIDHYMAHPDEAQAIIKNANQYVSQFFDNRRERIISTLVIAKYLGINIR